MDTKTKAPSTSEAFDKMYSSLGHLAWTDKRIPKELKELVITKQPKTSLELGSGLATFSIYMASQGINATGVDFSPTAIEKANKRLEQLTQKPKLLVSDVTNLKVLSEPFDVAFDVGCFHCLNETGQIKYVSELHRLLKPNATLLIWALDGSPSDIKLTPGYIEEVFENRFKLTNSKFSRRRVIASHWYWLTRQE